MRVKVKFFRDNLAHADVHVLPGVGHLPHAERPAEVARIISAFPTTDSGSH